MAFPTGWTQLARIDTDNTKVSGASDLSNFPALIKDGNLPANVYSNIESDGKDLRFTTDSAGTTEVPFEIVSITPASSLCEIWVKIPTLATATDTPIYVWGNNSGATAYAATDTYGSQAVWSAYGVVLHEESTTDSTANALNQTDTAITHATANGKIGKGALFNGSTSKFVLPAASTAISPGAGALTWQGWVKSTVGSVTQRIYMDHVDGTNQPSFTVYILNTNDKYYVLARDDGGDTANPGVNNTAIGNDDTYHKIDVVRDGTTVYTYTDGALDDSATTAGLGTIDIGTGFVPKFGAYSNNDSTYSQYFTGEMDEIRIIKAVNSADWLSTEYANQNSPSTFWSEVSPGGILSNLLLNTMI